MKLRRLSTAAKGFDAKLTALTRYEASADAKLQKTVARILGDVRSRGDASVLAYAKRFDKSTARSIAELDIQPRTDVPAAQLEALRAAHARIRAFHERQAQESWEYTEADGTRLGQRITPLERVGIYGHSGGGFLTAAAMLLPPYNEFFKVGVSESGNHDNNIYNQNWSEQYHGLKIIAKDQPRVLKIVC